MNWTIAVAIVVIALMILRLLQSGDQSVASPEAIAALIQQQPTIIDVRTIAEYQHGHLTQAINIPVDELSQMIARHAPDKARPLLLHCASGARSAAGKKTLEQLGYTNVHNLGSFRRAQSLLSKNFHPS